MKHIAEVMETIPLLRSKFLGGSDAPAVLGVSPWSSPLDIWRRKVDPDYRDEPDEKRARMFARGHLLEPVVIAMLQIEAGITSVQRNQRYTDAEHDFLSCELDGETSEGEIIEAKTVSHWNAREWGDSGGNEIPIYYAAQVQHQMMVAQRPLCYVAALIGVDDFRWYPIERDDEVIRQMREQELAFWIEHVLTKTPPEPRTRRDVDYLYRRSTDASIEADDALVLQVQELKKDQDELRRLDTKVEQEKLALQLRMGEASALAYGGRTLATWKTQKANRFDEKGFAAAYPYLHAQFKNTSEYRVFRVK